MEHHYKMVRGCPMPCWLLIGFLLLTGLSSTLSAQTPDNEKRIRIKGLVENEKGEPLSDVTVELKNDQAGVHHSVITNASGIFTMDKPAAKGSYTFVITHVGYITQTIVRDKWDPNKEESLYIILKEANAMNEVVVVGYGVQKKVNLTGAVSQVDAKTFADRPVSSAAQALQGAIPNLNITFGDGHPGSTGNFNVRGYASITNVTGSPLILIDGAPGDINMLNPQDIESLSVLKDAASAAVYGARGAFGVILVTTKQARKGKVNINYGASYNIQSITTRTDFITDGFLQDSLADVAFSRNVGNSYTGYTAADYAEMKKRQTDPSLPSVVVQNRNGTPMYIYYGNTDWWHFLFRKSQPGMEHHFSVSGGSDKVDFLLSGRYYRQEGMYQTYFYKNVYNAYNFRAKINAHVTPWLTLSSNTQLGANDYTYPGYSPYPTGYYNHAMASYVPKNPDGTYFFRTNLNNYGAYEYADLQNGKSHGGNQNYNLTNTLGFNASIVKGLSLTGNYTFELVPYSDYQRNAYIPWSVYPGTISKAGFDQLTENTHLDRHHSINLYVTYEKSLEKHDLKLTAGYNEEIQKYKINSTTRQNLLSDDLNQIDLGTVAPQAGGNAREWALLGYFGRINYDYGGKYLLELDGRYDGSSRFPSGQRFGFFPSISGGWRISKEAFFDKLTGVVSELKLRVSYGSLGNQDLGNSAANLYPYIPVMNSAQTNYIIDGNKTQVLSAPNPVTPNFTWERSATLNGGIDASFLKNHLLVSFDRYRRKTTNMLIPGQVLPAVFGALAPTQNAGDLVTNGFEVSIKWQGSGRLADKPFSYSFGIALSDYTAKITKFDNPKRLLGDNNHYAGQELGEIWGYRTDGYFKTDQEALSYPINQDYVDMDQRVASPGEWSKLHAGDLKFRDLNKDNVINDGKFTLDDHGDLERIGNTLPRYSFGINAGFNWNNFDLSVFFQGIGKQNWYPNVESSLFWGPYGRPYVSFVPKDFVNKIWSPSNPNAYFPLLRGYSAYPGGNLSVNNDRYLQDIAYIRLKNLTIGYNLPGDWMRRWKLQRLRLYFTGQNLFTWTKLKSKYIDPEQVTPNVASDAGGRDYPFFSQYSFGLDVNF
ncbi:MAG: TonB-dependent receptor [Chitinophagaceae bacterium]|nr:TonB-dependent receptor [Chitinophagaceae bacterium]